MLCNTCFTSSCSVSIRGITMCSEHIGENGCCAMQCDQMQPQPRRQKILRVVAELWSSFKCDIFLEQGDFGAVGFDFSCWTNGLSAQCDTVQTVGVLE